MHIAYPTNHIGHAYHISVAEHVYNTSVAGPLSHDVGHAKPKKHECHAYPTIRAGYA